jgi:hypothetical protein
MTKFDKMSRLGLPLQDFSSRPFVNERPSKRKRIEECGWLKTIALLRKVRHRKTFKVAWSLP